jgi:cyclin T
MISNEIFEFLLKPKRKIFRRILSLNFYGTPSFWRSSVPVTPSACAGRFPAVESHSNLLLKPFGVTLLSIGLKMKAKDWVFTRSDIERSASRSDSISLEKENEYRAKSIWFLFELAKGLNIQIYVASTAAIYFHRFFLFHSFSSHDRLIVSAVCLFLASKNEDSFRKLERIVGGYLFLKAGAIEQYDDVKRFQKQFNDDFEHRMKSTTCKEEMNLLKEQFLGIEKTVLITLCFEMHISHPHTFVSEMFKKMKSMSIHSCIYYISNVVVFYLVTDASELKRLKSDVYSTLNDR